MSQTSESIFSQKYHMFYQTFHGMVKGGEEGEQSLGGRGVNPLSLIDPYTFLLQTNNYGMPKQTKMQKDCM